MKTVYTFAAVVATMLLTTVAASAQLQQQNRQCARAMCVQIRNCSTNVQIPYAGGLPQSADGSKKQGKKDANTQGQEPYGTCRTFALDIYLNCAEGGQGGRIQPPLKSTGTPSNK